jgi:hypothetical protein
MIELNKPPAQKSTGALMQYIGNAEQSEKLLEDTFTVLAARHSKDAGVHNMLKQFAMMAKNHVHSLHPHIEKYGKAPDEGSSLLRSALFQGERQGELGLIKNLQDLDLLVTKTNGIWVSINQCAKSMNDQELVKVCDLAEKELNQQLAWLKTQVKNHVAQAVLVDDITRL